MTANNALSPRDMFCTEKESPAEISNEHFPKQNRTVLRAPKEMFVLQNLRVPRYSTMNWLDPNLQRCFEQLSIQNKSVLLFNL
jgi:hypothetical protein